MAPMTMQSVTVLYDGGKLFATRCFLIVRVTIRQALPPGV